MSIRLRLRLVFPFRRVAAFAYALVVAVERMAPAILDAVDEGRLDPLAAVGQHRIGRGHAQQRRLARAKRHREIGRQIVIDAEALGVFGDERHADVAGKAHGHLVDRMFDAIAQRVRTARLAFEILGTPDAKARPLIDFNRRVEHNRRRRITIVERRRIDEGLERGTRLAQRLRRPVEHGLVEGKSADHGEDAARIGIHGDDRAADLGDLAQAIFARPAVDCIDIDYVARRQRGPPAGAAGPAHAHIGEGAGFALAHDLAGLLASRLQANAGAGVIGVDDNRKPPASDVAERRDVGERDAPVLADVDMAHRSTEPMLFVVAHEAVDEGAARHQLHFRIERRADRKTALVELLFAVAVVEFAAHLLGEEAGCSALGESTRGLTPSGSCLAFSPSARET